MPDDAPLLAMATPMIRRDEGCSLTAYWDPIGHCWTIGWGRADPGVTEGMTCTQVEADAWRDAKLVQIIAQIDDAEPWWRDMALPRQAVWVDMAYEMGVHGLLGFKTMIADSQAGNYATARLDMLNSKWAKQVPNRANREATQYVTGVLQ